MKYALLIFFISVLISGPVSAFDCDEARVKYAGYLQEMETFERRIADLEKQKETAKIDYGRVDGELYIRISELNKKIAGKEEMFRQSIRERQELGEEHKKIYDELRMGLYCSKCNRSKTQIEKEERVSFAAHLRSAKATTTSAPSDILRKCSEDYNRKREISLRQTSALENELDLLYDQESILKREAEQRKSELLAARNSFEDQIQAQAIRRNPTIEGLTYLGNDMRANYCSQ